MSGVIKRLLAFSLLGLLAFTVQVAAQEDLVFTFEGSGWGHGVGMSQWGAYGQSLDDPDKSGEEIASYYYTDSQPADLSDLDLPNDLLTTLDNPLWVNIASGITLLEFTAVGGPLELCLAGDGEGPCPKPEQPRSGERWEFRRIRSGECGFYQGGVLQGTSGDCRASISWPEADGVRLRYGEDRSRPCGLRSEECEYRHGELKIRDDPVDLGFHVLLTIGLEDYVRGIAEILVEWKNPGVNEAQAIAARTYAAYKFFAREVVPRPADPNQDPGITASRMDSCWCHLYDNTRDQVYVGWWRKNGPDHEAWVTGVKNTEGRVLTYFGDDWERYTKGGIIQAFYSASSGGFTNSNRYGFFTEWDGRAINVAQWPYLYPVADPWDTLPALGSPVSFWRKTISAERIAGLLGWDEVTDVRLVSAPAVNSVSRVRFEGVNNGEGVTTTAAGGWLRYGLGLRSSVIYAIDDEPASPTATPTLPPEEEEGRGEGQAPDDLVEERVLVFDQLPLFQDIADSNHREGILTLWRNNSALGCGDTGSNFCPNDQAKRQEMAHHLATAQRLRWPIPPYDPSFEDVPEGHRFAEVIYAIAAAGITKGCTTTTFCPDALLTRGQMAAFLARSLDLEPAASFDGKTFEDVSAEHTHRGAIYAIANEGITIGCTATTFCPDDPLTRGQMATLLARAFFWKGPTPPDR
ncbi:MAG: S-layer homology domain-containing protein [bacterium]|nr:S-layer homology domain-containing protein [bacterium]MCY3651948.1 S-layer homology domain-containing protein [bacterium]MDE0644242.1 S-layer homology domain-containing protein [bacterium]MYD03361.1 hypothetical protein [Acidimicrobiia bacterium]